MAGTEEGEAEFDVTVFVTMTYSQAANAGLIDPTEVDPFEFAPYCEHDQYAFDPKVTEPLWSCGLCDSRLS